MSGSSQKRIREKSRNLMMRWIRHRFNRGHQNLELGNRAKKPEGESLEPDKIASGGVEISAAGTFRN